MSVNLRKSDNSSSFFPSPVPYVFILSEIIGKNQRESNNVENRDENGLDKQVSPKKFLNNYFWKSNFTSRCKSSRRFLKKLNFCDPLKVYSALLNSAPEKDARHKKLTMATG